MTSHNRQSSQSVLNSGHLRILRHCVYEETELFIFFKYQKLRIFFR